MVAGKPAGTVVLVGGGDPTLTGAAKGKPGTYPDAARVSDLAAQLSARHVHVTRIVVDSSLFAAPAISPDWDPSDVPTSYGAAITALMVDGGRAAADRCDPFEHARPRGRRRARRAARRIHTCRCRAERHRPARCGSRPCRPRR